MVARRLSRRGGTVGPGESDMFKQKEECRGEEGATWRDHGTQAAIQQTKILQHYRSTNFFLKFVDSIGACTTTECRELSYFPLSTYRISHNIYFNIMHPPRLPSGASTLPHCISQPDHHHPGGSCWASRWSPQIG